jgi:hypothetical protein
MKSIDIIFLSIKLVDTNHTENGKQGMILSEKDDFQPAHLGRVLGILWQSHAPWQRMPTFQQ